MWCAGCGVVCGCCEGRGLRLRASVIHEVGASVSLPLRGRRRPPESNPVFKSDRMNGRKIRHFIERTRDRATERAGIRITDMTLRAS